MLLDKATIRAELKAIAGVPVGVPLGMVPPPRGTASLKAELIGQALLVLDGHGSEDLAKTLKRADWDGLAELRLLCLRAIAASSGRSQPAQLSEARSLN
jgi:hypothetical protein